MRIVSHVFFLGLLLGSASSAVLAQSTVGGGLAVVPSYPGANSFRALPVPLVNFDWGPFFVSSRYGLPGAGLRMTVVQDLDVGVLLSVAPGRDESRGNLLAGLGDIDISAQYGVFAAWNPGRWHSSISYMQAARSGYGGALTLRGSYLVFQQGRHAVTVGGDVAWGNGDYMRTWFGITPEQAARSRAGLPAYQAASGLSSASAYATWRYRLSDRWSVSGTLGVQSLLGNAADSPVVERKTSAFSIVGVAYSF